MTVTGAKKLDPIADALLFEEEKAIFYGSRKGRQVVVTKIRKMAHDGLRHGLSDQQLQSMEEVILQVWIY